MMHVQPYIYSFVIIAFILYRRIKRSIGFQLFKTRRLFIRAILFSVIAVLLLINSAVHPISYLYDAIGIVGGIILLSYAQKHSQLEMRENLLYYRTHIWIESIVLLLFLSRFLYRFIQIMKIDPETQASYGKHFASDPLTMIVFFLLATYYIGYNLYIYGKGKKYLDMKSVS
ncbi:sporulation protein [Priestia koreensis]|uniref:sporulation protein n=1 Tax=Priestia koreensis TaxID=284581 RepID=UPI00345AA7BC